MTLPAFFLVFFLFILVVALMLFYTEFFGAGYFPASDRVVKRMIQFSRLGKKDVFYDMGCGDGRVLMRAAPFCKKAIGIEIDPLRYILARFNTRKIRNIHVLRGNFFSNNLKDADVVFIYLQKWSNRRLKDKFLKEMKPGSVIVSHCWTLDLPLWKKDEKLKVYAYRRTI